MPPFTLALTGLVVVFALSVIFEELTKYYVAIGTFVVLFMGLFYITRELEVSAVVAFAGAVFFGEAFNYLLNRNVVSGILLHILADSGHFLVFLILPQLWNKMMFSLSASKVVTALEINRQLKMALEEIIRALQ